MRSMSDDFFPVPAEWAASALFDRDRRAADYARSVEDAHVYWLEQAGRLDWVNFTAKTNESSFDEADFGVKWFADGVLNVSANCIDRHLATRSDKNENLNRNSVVMGKSMSVSLYLGGARLIKKQNIEK